MASPLRKSIIWTVSFVTMRARMDDGATETFGVGNLDEEQIPTALDVGRDLRTITLTTVP